MKQSGCIHCSGVILTGTEIVGILQQMGDGGNGHSNDECQGTCQNPGQNPHTLLQCPDLFLLRHVLAAGRLPDGDRIRTPGKSNSDIGVDRILLHNRQTFRAEHLIIPGIFTASHALHVIHPHFHVYHIVQQFLPFVKGFFRNPPTKNNENFYPTLRNRTESFTKYSQNNLEIALDNHVTICYYHITNKEQGKGTPGPEPQLPNLTKEGYP